MIAAIPACRWLKAFERGPCPHRAIDAVVTEPAETAQYAGRINVESIRLSDMIDDLFELSKINAGALRLKFHDVAVEGLVADAVESTTPAAREPRVLVDVRIEGGWPTVLGSDAELTRVLRNLPGNAVRHPPEDGGVTLVAGVDGA